MRYSNAAAVALAMLIATSANGEQTDPKKLKDQLTGDAKGSASANAQCKLFTQAEISTYVGGQVGPGENFTGGMGCRWSDKDSKVSARVSVVPPRYFPEPKLAKGFKRLPGVGSKGWVAQDMGWSAAALFQDEAIVVGVSGKAATEALAIRLLQEAIKRRMK
jgi:hypothetical protein